MSLSRQGINDLLPGEHYSSTAFNLISAPNCLTYPTLSMYLTACDGI